MITQELVKFLFNYKDGNLIRNFDAGGEKAGSIVGWLNPTGGGKKYQRTSIKGKSIYCHQAIFLYHHGYIPKYIDHINGNTFDNRIENLRETNQSLNTANSKLSKANTTGYKGVIWRKDIKKYHAQIWKNRKRHGLGFFETIEEAALAYKNAAIELFGEFARPEASNRTMDRVTQ
jgi:hypothetical protein